MIALPSYEDIARMIDHSLLRPELSEAEVIAGCELAKAYQVATACVRPSDPRLAAGLLAGSGVLASTVAGFPHGSQTLSAKLAEVHEAMTSGAAEVDMVLNIGKLISRKFDYVENEILTLAEEVHARGGILKVIFENAYLRDELMIEACRICASARADFVKTSTGFAPSGATDHDLRLMRAHSPEWMQVKAAGGVRTLDRALEVRALGCSRFGATATAAILDDLKARLAAAATAP